MNDPRFDTIEKRRDNRDEVNELVSAFTRERSMDDLQDLFAEHQVPHAPILGVTALSALFLKNTKPGARPAQAQAAPEPAAANAPSGTEASQAPAT